MSILGNMYLGKFAERLNLTNSNLRGHDTMPRCLRRGWLAFNGVKFFRKVGGFYVAVMPHPLR